MTHGGDHGRSHRASIAPRIPDGLRSWNSVGPCPKPPKADLLLAAHYGVTSDSLKAQQKWACGLQPRTQDQLPETARPPEVDDPMGRWETKVFAKALYRRLQGAGATA